MFTTPDEARKKVCSQRLPTDQRDQGMNCWGPDCMAWRWQSALTVFRDGSQDISKQKGFCGLAGRP